MMLTGRVLVLHFVFLLLVGIKVCCADYVQITSKNHDEVMKFSQLSFVAYTADWCPFSAFLLVNFEKAAREYNTRVEKKSTWANVDCVSQPRVCEYYKISKFPTMKVFLNGYLLSEYRGARGVEPLLAYIDKMENIHNLTPVTPIAAITEWQKQVDPKKATIVLWYPRNSAPYEIMLRAISLVHDLVNILVPAQDNKLEHEEHYLIYATEKERFEKFPGTISNFNEIADWIRKKTSGLVRELTFANAEALVEEAKPMLLLFRNIDDDEDDEKKYTEAIRRELDDKLYDAVNPLITDGSLMQFPLLRLGKTTADLPLLVVDTFVHTFQAPYYKDEIFEPGNIRKFVTDLLSENLHRRHHGLPETHAIEDKSNHGIENDGSDTIDQLKKEESVFKKLEPAKDRYSFAKQEL